MNASKSKGTFNFLELLLKDNRNRRSKAKSVMPVDELPLSGLRILDLTGVWSGPHATRLLADCGAEVIRIEYSKRMDIARGWSTSFERYNIIPNILQLNRNKRSITLDLKDSRGVDIFKELVKVADVVMENFRTGFMVRVGLGYDILQQIKPDIILVSMPGFGCTGPEASYPAYGAGLEALSGVQSLTAYDKGEKPRRVKELDMFNGLHGASAVMTALLYRQMTGKGQWVDLSQLETSTTGLIGEHLLEYEMNNSQTLPLGNRHPSFAPHGCYRCEGDDKWVVIAVRTEAEWEKFCAAVGHPEWKDDERFRCSQDRLRHHDELDHLIETWTTHYTHYEAMHILQQAGIAAGAVLNAAEVCSDPHVNERGFIRNARDAGEGGLRFPGVPFKFSEGNGEVFWRGQRLGEDNEYVLCEILGRPKDDLEILKYDKVGTAFDLEDE